MSGALFLDGGPRRGRHMAWNPPALPLVIRVAIPPANLKEVLLADEPFAGDQLQPLTFGAYTPMYDPLGMPYHTDAGHPIYHWRGVL